MKLSVLMPSFNSGAFIRQAVESVRVQQAADWELIAQDAGSTDGTLAIIESFADPRVRVFSEPDRGQSHALNLALAKATGDWAVWLNADDLLRPDAFRAVVPMATDDTDLVFGNHDVIDAGGRTLKSYRPTLPTARRLLARDCYVFSGATCWRTAFLRDQGGFDESLHYAMDYDLLLRAVRDARIRQCGTTLAAFRRQDAGKTTARPWPMYREARDVRFRHAHGRIEHAIACWGHARLGAYIATRTVWQSAAWRRLTPVRKL